MTRLTAYGETDGTTITGTFPLGSEWFGAPVTEILLEKGLSYEIKSIEVSGAICDVTIEVTYDADWTHAVVIKQIKLEAAKQITVMTPATPHILNCHLNDMVKLRARWTQTTAAKTYLTLTIDTIVKELA